MGLFSFFRKRPPTAQDPAADPRSGAPNAQPHGPLQLGDPAALPVAPEQVRRLLFDAVVSGNEGKLEELCREHKELILEYGADWLTIPPEFRSNPDLSDWYSNGLHAISRFCAERLGHAEMLERLAEAESRLAASRPRPQ
jgi:hypothetical protein